METNSARESEQWTRKKTATTQNVVNGFENISSYPIVATRSSSLLHARQFHRHTYTNASVLVKAMSTTTTTCTHEPNQRNETSDKMVDRSGMLFRHSSSSFSLSLFGFYVVQSFRTTYELATSHFSTFARVLRISTVCECMCVCVWVLSMFDLRSRLVRCLFETGVVWVCVAVDR